jgi:Bacterial cellulose synthase subunit
MIRLLLLVLLAVCMWVGLALPARAQGALGALAENPPGPLDQVVLGSLGYQDTTLRGRLVLTDYFVPGPGNYALSDENWLDLTYRPSDLLREQSVMTILWNGMPLQEVALQPTSDAATDLTIHVPRERVDPAFNRLQVQAALQIKNEDCVEENPARHLTIFNTSQVRYGYGDRQPIAVPIGPDLARYPAPFFTQNNPQPAPVRLVLPANPSSSELTAAVRVVAQLGQFGGSRGLPLEFSRADNLADLTSEHLVFVGRAASLPSLAQLPNPPGGVRRAEDGGYLDDAGQPVPAGTGVVLEVNSPWNPARAALVVTGADDQAVERASTAVASREGIRALHGQVALVSAVQSPELITTPTPTLLSDLGRSDDTISGVGQHSISFAIEAASLAGSSSLPLDLDVSHSPLLDPARSSMRVVLNGTPVSTTSFRDLAPSRARTRVDLPPAALKPGSNTLSVEFDLSLPRLEDQQCARIPTEQAWAVLHADSALVPADAPGTPDDVTLASYPYPFVRGGRLDTALLVLPDHDLGDGTALLRLVADLGRATRGPVLAPRVVRASEFDPAMAADADVIVWGLPEANSVLGRLSERLPIQVDETGRRLVLSRDLTLAVRDTSRLGVVQEVASPWSAAGHSVLAVTASTAADLTLAVDALRQGSLSGNAALASRAILQTPIAGRTPTPEPLVVGGPPPQPLQVSTFRLRPRIEAPAVAAAHRPPFVQYAAGILAGATILLALGLALRAFGPSPDRR